MSKLTGKLSYKSWCILKHGLERSIETKEEWTQSNRDGVYETYDEELKELEEVTEMIEQFKLYFKGHGNSEYRG